MKTQPKPAQHEKVATEEPFKRKSGGSDETVVVETGEMVSEEHLESSSGSGNDGRKVSSGRQRGEEKGATERLKPCETNVNDEPQENVSSEETVPDQGGKYFLLP